MVNSRAFLFVLFAAAAAALLFVVVLNGVSRVIFLSTLFFLLGFAAALLRRRRSMNSSRARVFVGETSFSVDGLGSELLSTTLNEMREGLLVIDTDMRIVASNRAAQDLFSNVDTAINNRRMTEITRNPAIYDAFLATRRGDLTEARRALAAVSSTPPNDPVLARLLEYARGAAASPH